MDQEIGRLLDALRQLDLDRRTMVIVTSDHGEALGENGLGGHAYLYDVNLRVPLLLALPDRRHAGTRVAVQVQSIDIVPTVLEALAIPAPAPVDGQSLLPLLSGRPTAARPAWSYAAETNHGIALRLDGGLKYVFSNNAWPAAHGREQLLRIDRKTGEEREEAGRADERSRLRRELLASYAVNGPPAVEVAVVNRFATELRGTIGAKALRPTQVKALEPAPGALGWRARRVVFTVPPGRRLHLFLEGGFQSEIALSLRGRSPGGEVRVKERVGPSEFARTPALRLALGETERWVAGPLGEGSSGVELVVRGGKRAEREEVGNVPDEVREQLRALGYEE
jgi:hypothetical protein